MTLNIYDLEGKKLLRTIEPDGEPARLAVKNIPNADIDGLPVQETVYGEPSELPEGNETYYIVSTLYRTRSLRADLLSPGQAVRDASGNQIGCKGLIR